MAKSTGGAIVTRRPIVVAHLADSHFDERLPMEEAVQLHEVFLDQAHAAGVDAILHAGDLHNRMSSPEVREAAGNFLQRAAHIAPVVVVGGNHDPRLDLAVYRRVKARHPVLVEQTGIRILELPLADGRELGVVTLPWFDKGYLVAQAREQNPTSTDAQAALALTQVLEGLSLEVNGLRDRMPCVGLGHLLIGGAAPSIGQTLIGVALEIQPEDLMSAGVVCWLLGHVHRSQSWVDGRVGYSGSLQRLNHGEPERKGWRRLELFPDPEAIGGATIEAIEFVEVPALEIVHLDVDWTDEHSRAQLAQGAPMLEASLAFPAGARVRIRYAIRPEDTGLVDRDRLKAVLLAKGAGNVKIEPEVRTTVRVRSEAIAHAQGIPAQVVCWLEKVRPDLAARYPVILEKVAAIEAEVRACE